MKSRTMYRKALYLILLAVAGIPLCGCSSLDPSADGPGDCVGPPDYCIPYFGS
jgi:hypothetical protein